MPLDYRGFKLALDLLTDATDGINFIAVASDLNVTDRQAITFAAATSTDYGGNVVDSNTPLTFGPLQDYETVQAVVFYHGTTQVGYAEVTEVTSDNDYYYVVDSVTITNS